MYAIAGLLLLGIGQTGDQYTRAQVEYATQYVWSGEAAKQVCIQQKRKIDLLYAVLARYAEALRRVENDHRMLKKYIILRELDGGINEELAKATIYYAYQIAPHYNLDPDLVVSIAFVESRFTNLFGSTGDYGVMQINYETWAEELDITMADLLDIKSSVVIACQILSLYQKQYGDKFIAGYNGFGSGYEQRVNHVYERLQ